MIHTRTRKTSTSFATTARATVPPLSRRRYSRSVGTGRSASVPIPLLGAGGGNGVIASAGANDAKWFPVASFMDAHDAQVECMITALYRDYPDEADEAFA